MVRIFGSPGRSRRLRSLLGIIFSLGLIAMIAVPIALAVHDNGFLQLDRDAYTADQSDPPATEDWDKICPTSQPAGIGGCLGGTAADSSSFITDGDTDGDGISDVANASIFTQGGSKDIHDVTSWRHKDGSVPDKDDLLHAFAAREGDDLYFGADRLAVQGTATLGVWFLQGNVAPVTGGTFSGEHKEGDILVLSDFQASGANASVRVFEWLGGDGVDGSLALIAGTATTPADCVGPPTHPTSGAGSEFCATSNTGNEDSPWAFQSKSGAANIFLPGLFFEGGVDLAALDLDEGCFGSFLAETRASNEPGATLKDFVTGPLERCVATMTTQVSSPSVLPGAAVTDTATVVGSSADNTPTGNVTFFLCSFAAGSTTACDGTGLPTDDPNKVGTQLTNVPPQGTLSGTGTTATATSPAVNTAASPLSPGRYCFRAEWPGDDNYVGALTEFSIATECFTVAKINTQTVTTPVDASGTPTSSITLTGSIYDKAVVTGTAAGGDPTGTVKFFVCKLASGTCDGTINVGTQVGTPAEGETLVSDGVAGTFTSSATSDAFTPLTVGRYCFRAEYGGSTVYNASGDSAATECFTVTDSTGITSAQKWLPNDSATVTSVNGAPLNGTLTITLHESSGCTGDAVSGQTATKTLTNAITAADRTLATSNSTYEVLVTRSVSWKTVFASTDANVSGFTKCETTSLTITN